MEDNRMTINGNEYEVVRLLGKGKGGYSYLVTDGHSRYVLKQIHHEPCEYYTFGDKLKSELNDYETLRKTGITMPKLLAVDEEKERLLKEYIQGDTVYELVKTDRMEARWIEKMQDMCKLLYPANLISRQILSHMTESYITSITNVIPICRNGILNTGELNTGPRPKSFWNMRPKSKKTPAVDLKYSISRNRLE